MAAERQAVPDATEMAAQALAAELADALSDGNGTFRLHRWSPGNADRINALGALRVLGADVLAPFVVAGHTLAADDTALLRVAVRAFPAPASGTADGSLWVRRDAALAQVLSGLGVDTGDWEGLAADGLSGGDGSDGTGNPAVAQDWPMWSAHLVRLSSLALPPVNGPLREQTRVRRRELARGMTRSLLRRDYLSAARLARWLALDAPHAPDREPLLDTALEHLDHLAPDQPRTRLEVAIARRLLGGVS